MAFPPTGLGLVPQSGATPNPPPNQPSTTINDFSQLAGNPMGPGGPNPAQSKVQFYMNQVRNVHIAIDNLAQQYPEAAPELDKAKQALTDSMARVAAAASAPDNTPQPQTF